MRRPKFTFLDKMTSLSFGMFGSTASRLAKRFPSLKENLLKSGLTVTPEGLMSIALFSTAVSLVPTFGLLAIGVEYSFRFTPVFVLIPVAVFLLTVNAPRASQSSRSASLDSELSFLVGFMAILAGGGETLMNILRRVSTMRIFPASSKEARRILADVDIYGLEPVEALERAARHTPNRWFAELLSGYATVLKTGGDHINYMNVKLKEVFEQRAATAKRSAENTGSMAEIYLIVTTVLGITIFALYLVQALLVNSSGGLFEIEFFAFVGVPLVSAVIIWLLDLVQPKWPYNDYRPYRVFVISVPFGLIIYLLPISTYPFVHLAMAMVAMTIPAAYVATKYSGERRGIERNLPDFIRDVAEGRKIGLSPEAAIERLVEAPYGRLSKPVHKMAAQLTWGFSVKKVLVSFTRGVNSWIAKAAGTLMLEVIEVGGGTVKGFSELADFTRHVSESETELRSSLRAYVLIAYVSAVMIVGTTFIFVFFLTQGTALGGNRFPLAFTINGSTVELLFTASVFEAWVIGLTSGKMGEGSIAEGFKHAVILVFVTVLTVAVVGSFFPIPL